MPLFRETKFDAKAEADYAHARINRRKGVHNVQPVNYAIPIGGAVAAILFTLYALSRPSVKELLSAPPAPATQEPLETLEIDLE